MSYRLNISLALGMAVMASGPLNAQVAASPSAAPQGVVMQRAVSLDLAKSIAEASLSECRSKGFHIAVAVVDRAGQTIVLLRDEQAAPHLAELARRKAYTARIFRISTVDFQKRTATEPTMAAQRNIADVIALGGGMPLVVGTETIGGVGSAGSTPDMDDACAKAGAAKMAELLK